jgi:hypothetical protein
MTLFFHNGPSEPLVFAFDNHKMNDFCKWNGDTIEELYRIFDLFVSIKPLFKSLKLEDDEGIWYSYLARNKPCKIQLRSLRTEQEQRLLRRMLDNLATPPDEFEKLIIDQSGLRPFHPSLLRIIVQDFIKIMNYRTWNDFHPEAIMERAGSGGFALEHPAQDDIRNFRYVFCYSLLRIWFSDAFTYQTDVPVHQVPGETRGLLTSEVAALYGTLSVFMNLHGGGAANVKEAEMIKLAAKYYPAGMAGEVMVVDEPERELTFFVSMMDYLGFRYAGV